MFAPVVHRFRTYAIEVASEAADYMATMMALPAFQEWTRAGLAETIVIEKIRDGMSLQCPPRSYLPAVMMP